MKPEPRNENLTNANGGSRPDGEHLCGHHNPIVTPEAPQDEQSGIAPHADGDGRDGGEDGEDGDDLAEPRLAIQGRIPNRVGHRERHGEDETNKTLSASRQLWPDQDSKVVDDGIDNLSWVCMVAQQFAMVEGGVV